MLTKENARAAMSWIAPVATASSFFMWLINVQIEKAVEPIKIEVHSIAVSVEYMKQITKNMQAEKEDSSERVAILDNRLLNLEQRLATVSRP